MQKVFRVTVDISKKIPAPAFEVNTNDLKSVKLEITITNGQSLLDLTDVTPRINIRKPDNEVIFQDCEIVDATAGKVQIVLENQAYLVPGTHTAEIACYKGNEITAITGTFSYKSVKGIMNDEAVESKSEFTAIDRKIEEARKLLEDVGENGVGVDEQARQKIEEVTTRLTDTSTDVKKRVRNNDTTKHQAKPLFMNTFEGSSDTLHPDILYIPEGFGGYTYWMAYTPLPAMAFPYTDRYECPSIVCSKDGYNFTVKQGFANPLDDLTETEITAKGYFSDPCLVYNPTTKKLEVYYRLTKDNSNAFATTFIYRKTTDDGVTWSARETVFDPSSPGAVTGTTARSQQVVLLNGTYYMYYQTENTSSQPTIRRVQSTNPANNSWSNTAEIVINGQPRGKYPWHFNIFYDRDESKYHLCGFIDADEKLIYATSTDGINFTYLGDIFQADVNSFNNINGVYQSTLTKVNGIWNVYVTGYKNIQIKDELPRQRWGQYLLQGSDPLNLSFVEGNLNYTPQYYLNSPVLYNSKKANNVGELRYKLYESEDKTREYSYGYNKDTDEAPVFYDGYPHVKRPIFTSVYSNSFPNIAPRYKGQWWIRDESDEIYYSNRKTGGAVDWKRLLVVRNDGVIPNINNAGAVINQNRKNVESANDIDVANSYRVVINTGTVDRVNKLINGVDGQEIILLNALNININLTNNSSGDGGMRITGGADKVLKQFDCIRFTKIGATWYQN